MWYSGCTDWTEQQQPQQQQLSTDEYADVMDELRLRAPIVECMRNVDADVAEAVYAVVVCVVASAAVANVAVAFAVALVVAAVAG